MKEIKRYAAVTAMALFLCAWVFCSIGVCEDEEVKVVHAGDETTATYVRNSACPVSDDDIVEKEAVMVEYDGKIYNLCCSACVKHFKKFPEKFALKVSQGK